MFAYALSLIAIFWLRPDDTLAKTLVAILGSMLLFRPCDVVMYWFESQVLSKYSVWVQNGSFLVFSAVKVVLIFQGGSLIAFTWVSVAEALLAAMLLVAVFKLHGPAHCRLRVTLTRAKNLINDSWPLLLSGIAIVVYMRIDQIMLGQMIGNDAVGIYSAATRISEVWYFIPMSIAASLAPAILDAKKRSESLYYQRLQHLYDMMVWLSVIIALPMTFLSTPLVILLFGEAYSLAGTVLAIHIWAAVFVFLGVASSQWFIAENRQVLSFQRTALGAFVNVLLNFLLIPRFGAVGAATATVFAQFSVAFLFDGLQKETRYMFIMKTRSFDLFRLFRHMKGI